MKRYLHYLADVSYFLSVGEASPPEGPWTLNKNFDAAVNSAVTDTSHNPLTDFAEPLIGTGSFQT